MASPEGLAELAPHGWDYCSQFAPPPRYLSPAMQIYDKYFN